MVKSGVHEGFFTFKNRRYNGLRRKAIFTKEILLPVSKADIADAVGAFRVLKKRFTKRAVHRCSLDAAVNDITWTTEMIMNAAVLDGTEELRASGREALATLFRKWQMDPEDVLDYLAMLDDLNDRLNGRGGIEMKRILRLLDAAQARAGHPRNTRSDKAPAARGEEPVL
jgi:hypothetical protein